jgi:hypothetical protein
MTSLKEKQTQAGITYKDKLFLSVHRDHEMQEVKFYYYKINETEASNVISALPLVVQEELGLDPYCFFHRSDCKNILDGLWDTTNRTYKNKNMINQEQYLNDLEDCFLVNRKFVPQEVRIDSAESLQEAQQVAMANGEDDVSIISNLTDKTLKAAMKPMSKNTGDASSTESGMTSKSKTQLAVKAALLEVSSEHNKAMVEQQKKFQQEIEQLRRALEQQQTLTKTPNTQDSTPMDTLDTVTTDIVHIEKPATMEVDDSSDDTAPPIQPSRQTRTSSLAAAKASMEVDDSSDDTAPPIQLSRQNRTSSSAAAKASMESPSPNRPNKKLCTYKGRGGPKSASKKSDV